jgi:hypothetical protein
MQDKEEGDEEAVETLNPYFLGQGLRVTLYYIGF